MSRRHALLLVSCSLASVAIPIAPLAAQMTPVAATGWNRDIVVESTASAPYAASAQPFDVNNNWSWYERTLPGSTKGLAVGGTFNTVADPLVSVQLQPYTGPNALFLDAGSPTNTLTLNASAQVAYDALGIVASSASGGGTGTLVITFTDASVSGTISFNAQDWFNVTTNNAANNLGRVNLTSNAVDDASANNPRLYYTAINLASLGLNNRAVASIAFTKPAASNSTAVFAISGRRAFTAITPVSATGWNRDIVVENTGVAPFTSFAEGFDTFNNIGWYENGLPGSTKGLPQGGAFTSLSSAAVTGQLQPYNAPNALFLDVNAPTQTLTLAPASARPYEFLAIFASSSNQGGLGSMVITFSDNSTSPTLSFNAQDWFNVTTNNALNNLGRLDLDQLATDDSSTGNPRIYQTIVDLGSLGLSTRAVSSITFTKPAVGDNAQNTVIMAVSGQPTPGTTGACTFPDGTCALVPQANCTGTFQGNGTSCPPTGACIAASGVCTIRYQANCTFISGMYLGNDTTCPAPGACIAANGDCTQVNSFQCMVQNGMFLGAASPCPGTGACCVSGACLLRNSFQCAFAAGDFQGVGTTCAVSYPAGIATGGGAFEDISSTGAEIVTWAGTNDDGNATIPIGFSFPFFNNTYTSAFVVTNGMIAFGTATTDFSNDCPAPNAVAPNNAIFPNWDDFHIGTTTFLHPGRVYTETRTSPNRLVVQWNRVGHYNDGDVPIDENTFQAVLFETGNIEFRYGPIAPVAACDATIGIEDSTGTTGLNFDNTQLGSDDTALTIAAVGPCPQTPVNGACCSGTVCAVDTQANCVGANSAYSGNGTTCNAPGNYTSPCCKADYNHIGGIGVQDIFDFLAGYFSSSPQADINGGGVGVQDIFDFLAIYFAAGC